MKRNRVVICITFCLFLWSFFAIGAKAQPTFQNPDVLDEKRGVPSKNIYVITKDSTGFIWIGTDKGLCRYDGCRIKLFQHDKYDPKSLNNNVVSDILPEANGVLWVATWYGIAVYDQRTEQFKQYLPDFETPGKLAASRVRCLYKDRQGTIWAGVGSAGITKFDRREERFDAYYFRNKDLEENYPINRVNTVLGIQQDVKNDSILWLATLSGLMKYNKYSNDFHLYFNAKKDKDYEFLINAFKEIWAHGDGQIYLGSWAGATVFKPESREFSDIVFDKYKGVKAIYKKSVNNIWQYSERYIWLTFQGGMAIYDVQQKQVCQVFYDDEQAGKYFGVEYMDDQGRIWTISDQGILHFNPLNEQYQIYYFPAPHNNFYFLPRRLVESKDKKQLYVCVDHGEGVYVFDRPTKEWTIVRPDKFDFPNDQSFGGMDMLRLSDGRILVLGLASLYEFEENERTLKQIKIDFGVKAPAFRRMAEGERDDIWIGSRREGLFRLNKNDYSVKQYKEELEVLGSTGRYSWIEEIFKDSRNNIWFRTAYDYSLYLSGEDQFMAYTSPLDSGSNAFNTVWDFAEDNQGKMWIAGSEKGLGQASVLSPEKGVMAIYNKENGLLNENIRQLTIDDKGFVWIDAETGISKLDPKQDTFAHFDKKYGIPESNHDLFQTLSSGHIVMGLRKGICIFHPDSLRTNKEMPIPYLTSFKVFDEELFKDTSLLKLREVSLSYRQNFFSFEFSSIGYNLSEKNTYAYQLVGVDNNWIEAGKRNYASYTNIEGGDYIFQVKVANNEGMWSNKQLKLRIRISTPWWRTWIFWFLLFVGMAGLVSIFIRWRILQIKNKAMMKSEFEKKLANVELNALRAQMNPHFIFNCLNSIDYYILKNDTEKASDYLNRFSRLIRLILQNSRSDYVNLKEELEALKLYIEMESLRFEEQFDYAVKITKGLALEEIEIPPMLLQPYVENAIWHGLMQKEGKGRLDLILTKENGHLNCVIQDNGIGREAAMNLRSKTATKRKSMGMTITSDRINIINKLYSTKAKVKVVDLKDLSGKPTGTRVVLDIPI